MRAKEQNLESASELGRGSWRREVTARCNHRLEECWCQEGMPAGVKDGQGAAGAWGQGRWLRIGESA